ncbi:hypothetical protein H696_04961 [Fonticula alba]|uniref:Cytochrome c domain-containing protein n=1 Tax=Fonticula alba TaxID=691883 RepID=A0A058Z330_FONAL|nr:hypothetical protein H696_04961 [Fonticula alba]KCV68670.1 hypothetical protein H696_04961 [Fonticula alba]|eukprot:XP_009497102.1 hypothetical protein H696_04961 [Fonticula alba]
MSSSDISALLGKKLLAGWTMLGEHCPNCHTVPLMSLRSSKEMHCVKCLTVFVHQNDALEVVGPVMHTAPPGAAAPVPAAAAPAAAAPAAAAPAAAAPAAAAPAAAAPAAAPTPASVAAPAPATAPSSDADTLALLRAAKLSIARAIASKARSLETACPNSISAISQDLERLFHQLTAANNAINQETGGQ